MAARLFWFVMIPAAGLSAAWIAATRPMPKPSHTIRVNLPAHTGILEIGSALQREGVIRNAYAFAIMARLNGKAASLKSGRYRFAGSLTLDGVIDRLAEGPNDTASDLTRVTIPEGYTVDQIADLLETKGIVSAYRFRKYALNPNVSSTLITDFPLPPGTLEGYLFPDTYDLQPASTPSQVAAEMLLNFSKRFYRPYQHEIEQSEGGLSSIVIEASLIEREAREAPDRARIAGVLQNRLHRGMKLQIDASVMYGADHKARLFDADLKRDSPYNTYLHAGLPPGPIACPGAGALLAALRPEKSQYLFYVARPNGYHYFTSSFAEHEKAIRKARSEWAAQGGPPGGARRE